MKNMTTNRLTALLASVLLIPGVLAAADAGNDRWIRLSDDLAAFQQPTGDWFIAGNARMAPDNEKRLAGEPGEGVLINGPKGNTKNLITRQQWGDVNVSLEFMIPRLELRGEVARRLRNPDLRQLANEE